MLKFLGIAAAAIVAVVLVIVLIATTKPSTFSVSRSIDIAATPEKITPLVQDFHNFPQWSPWQHLDPNMTITYSGAPSGVGAHYAWKGNSKAGEGSMEILKATPTDTVTRVTFIKPFPSDNTTEYTLTPAGTVTHVTWTMSGPLSFPGKVMTVFTPMDKMVGGDFERGLASLKTLAEKQ